MKENTMNIYQKLQAARIALAKMNIKKSGKNTFSNFSYYELGDFLPQIQQLGEKLKFSPVFSVAKDGTYASLTIIDMELPKNTIVFSCPMSTAQLKACHPVQNLGAALTYTRRYLYTMAFEIVEADVLNGVMGAPAETADEGFTWNHGASPKTELSRLWRYAGFSGNMEEYITKRAKSLSLPIGDELYTKTIEDLLGYCKSELAQGKQFTGKKFH